MSSLHRRGLVVGKFCPLHLGHEWLIETAQAQCDELLVISYTQPAFAHCAAESRERWLRERFPRIHPLVLDDTRFAALALERGWPGAPVLPHNDAGEALHRDFVGWLCWRVFGCPVDVVFTSEDYGDGFAHSLGEYFRKHMDARDGGVQHVCVDRQRRTHPVSGSAIRSDPHAWREQLSPRVYADFVQRICLLGGESSGKTVLARALAEQLGTLWVPEYGRQRWVERGGELGYEDMLPIARTQLARERELAGRARRWLVCDTSPLTTLLYCRDLFGRAPPMLEQLGAHRYDHVLLCAPDFPFVQDGTRRDDAFRQHQHAWYLRELESRETPFTVMQGALTQRVKQAVELLDPPVHVEAVSVAPTA